MKRFTLSLLLLVSIVFIIPAADIPDNLKADLIYLAEEEKLARDVYLKLGELWNLRIFENIARAETVHLNRVGNLAAGYGLELTELPEGQFHSAELQELYDELISLGSESSRDALEVGRSVEIKDIEDIRAMLESEVPDDVYTVLTDLLKGSENHLSAFNRQLNS